MGLITAIGSFFTLSTVISVLLAVFVIVQAIAQVLVLTVLRRRQPALRRPYQPVALSGAEPRRARGLDVRVRLGRAGRRSSSRSWCSPRASSAFLVWARIEREWPFGPKHVREAFLEEQADRAPRRAVA